MSKELEALDSIMVSLAEYKEYAIVKLPTKAKEIREENDDDFLIVEAALKRLEDCEKQTEMDSNLIKIFQKKLKALEIIKEKVKIEFNDHYFGFANNYYIIVNNGVLNPIKVTEEEYNLLKEVLL